jgi:hypothetical protein
VLVRAEDNAATEHIAEGVNGFVATDLTPASLAERIVACHQRGQALRESTADWFAANARELGIRASLDRVVARYHERLAG